MPIKSSHTIYINARILDGLTNSTIDDYRTANIPYISTVNNNEFKVIYKMSSINNLGYSLKIIQFDWL